MRDYPLDKPTLAGTIGGVPVFSDPGLPPNYMMRYDLPDLGPTEFYAASGEALNLYREALGAPPLTDEEIAALPRTEDGLIVVKEPRA